MLSAVIYLAASVTGRVKRHRPANAGIRPCTQVRILPLQLQYCYCSYPKRVPQLLQTTASLFAPRGLRPTGVTLIA